MNDVDNHKKKFVPSNKPKETNDNESSMPLNLTKNETFSPWKYCLATYEESNDDSTTPFKKVRLNKKSKEKDKTFECSWCKKKFGWSTDLKRHLLIHTGTYLLILLLLNFVNINNISLFKILYIMKLAK